MALDLSSSIGAAISSNADFSVDSQTLDQPSEYGEEYSYEFSDAPKHLGYYKTIPELKGAIDRLAIWTVGKGLTTDALTQATMENWIGNGSDTYQSILENLLKQKKAFGDAFAEIVEDEDKQTINLKPLFTGDVKIIFNGKAMIKRYEIKGKNGQWVKMPVEKILHLSNDRIGNEVHGISVIDVCKWVIDARNEALTDHRKVIHRNVVPVRIIEIDTDSTTKRDALIAQYKDAIEKGEVLVIPKGTVSIQDNTIKVQDPITWISYLENFFYQAVGVPRVIASSQEYSEASSKVGYLTFEPIYTREQTLFESELWNQLSIKVKFNRPPSLGGFLQESEAKNTGQTGFQQSDMTAGVNRSE